MKPSRRSLAWVLVCAGAAWLVTSCGDDAGNGGKDASVEGGVGSGGTGGNGRDDGGNTPTDKPDAGTDSGLGACPGGFGDCDGDPKTGEEGCETDLQTLQDCGECGHTCALDNASARCSMGTCTVTACKAGFGDCDSDDGTGCETDIKKSNEHCGACGTDCGTLAKCSKGACVLKDACPSGFDDCNNDPLDGCETPLNTLSDCGFCGQECMVENGAADCDTGTCEIACQELCTDGIGCTIGECKTRDCDADFGDCDGMTESGCETSLNSLGHCGGCNQACNYVNADEECLAGVCTLKCTDGTCDTPDEACAPNYDDCNDDLGMMVNDGCETPLNTITDCGACDNLCDNPSGTDICHDMGSDGDLDCDVSGCLDGYYTVPGDTACACLDTPVVTSPTGTTCAAANILTARTTVGTDTYVGTLPVPGASDWYKVQFGTWPARQKDKGVKVFLDPAASSANYKIDVWNDTCTGTRTCPGAAYNSEDLMTWEFKDNCTSPSATSPSMPNICQTNTQPSFPTTVYVRVKRTGGEISCEQYSLKVQRY